MFPHWNHQKTIIVWIIKLLNLTLREELSGCLGISEWDTGEVIWLMLMMRLIKLIWQTLYHVTPAQSRYKSPSPPHRAIENVLGETRPRVIWKYWPHLYFLQLQPNYLIESYNVSCLTEKNPTVRNYVFVKISGWLWPGALINSWRIKNIGKLSLHCYFRFISLRASFFSWKT